MHPVGSYCTAMII